MGAVSEIDARFASLVSLHDDIGVLSVYVGTDPSSAGARPTWAIQLDAELRVLRARVHEEADHEGIAAFDRRLRTLEPELARLTDAAEHGRGRALFAAVASDEVHTLSAQAAFPTRAVLGPVVHIVPLLSADSGYPGAVVLLGRDRVRLLEARLDGIAELQAFDIEPVVYAGSERKGPAAANPLRGAEMVTQRERYERHLEASHQHLLRTVAEHVVRLTLRRGSELAVVAGDPRGANVILRALTVAGVETEAVDRDLIELSPSRALAELAPSLALAAGRRDLACVLHAREAAAARERGTVGLAPVVQALREGRVNHLFLDGERTMSGALGAYGELLAAGGPVPADPQFADHMVLRALQTGARVSVVAGAAASALEDVDGVAAALRW